VPELPDKKLARFEKEFALPSYDAEILIREIALADFFEKTVHATPQNDKIDPKTIANWIINKKVDYEKIAPEEMLKQISSAKQTVVIDEKELDKLIDEVIKENEKAVVDYKNGKDASLMFLLGQTMKKIGKKVDTQIIKTALIKRLS